MRNESEQLKVLRQRLTASENENHRLKLKNEGLEIMIDIAENHGTAPIESSRISQRVRAGMARAKAQGKQIPRPCLAKAKQKATYELFEQGVSMNQISKRLGIAYGTVYNYVQKRKSGEELSI